MRGRLRNSRMRQRGAASTRLDAPKLPNPPVWQFVPDRDRLRAGAPDCDIRSALYGAGFSQDRRDDTTERWEVPIDDLPNQIEVDPEVVVDQLVSHARNLTPRHLGVRVLDSI